MNYNFKEFDTLLSVRDALRVLDSKLLDAKYRIEALSSFSEVPETFAQLLTEASAFQKTSEYEILKEYQSFSNCVNFFGLLNMDLLRAFKRKKHTFSTINRIIKKLEQVERIVEDVLEELQNKYFL